MGSRRIRATAKNSLMKYSQIKKPKGIKKGGKKKKAKNKKRAAG